MNRKTLVVAIALLVAGVGFSAAGVALTATGCLAGVAPQKSFASRARALEEMAVQNPETYKELPRPTGVVNYTGLSVVRGQIGSRGDAFNGSSSPLLISCHFEAQKVFGELWRPGFFGDVDYPMTLASAKALCGPLATLAQASVASK